MYGEKGWLPVETRNIKVMSIGFLLKNEDDAVVWRGPKKHGKQYCYKNEGLF